MTDNLVSTMIKQHRGLQEDLGKVAEDLKDEKPDAKDIHKLLGKFTKDLTEHLELENNTFYVQLLKKMKEKGQDIAKTEQFVGQMKDIEKVVVAFLEKYGSAKSIEEKIEEFRPEFKDILDTLVLRIESEEAGVYAYWGLF